MVSMIAISSLASSSPCAPFLSHKLFWSKILSEQCHRSLSPPCPLGSERGLRSVCFFNAGDNSESKFQDKESGLEWPIIRRWEVPWQWQTISITSLACGLGQFCVDRAAVVLGVLYSVASTYQPLSEDFFKYDWREPFNLQKGWLLWAGPGLAGALIAIGLTGAAMSFFSGETPKRETDVLVSFLPLIGSSNVSTACLVGITGVLAPLLEETVFRGFFLAPLTKWVSTPVAVIVSAAVFALAHLTPGEFPQLFVLGTVLGISYAQTRNLLTPITIHAFWNSGVILLLTFLQLQGYDIKELLQTT